MTRLLRLTLHSSILLLSCSISFAMLHDTTPIRITSNRADFDQKSGTATYHGNVMVVQGTRKLLADKLTIQKDSNNKIKTITAYGKPAKFSSTSDPAKPSFGQAKKIKYYPQTDKLELLDQASITQKGDTINGPKLTYDFITEKLQSDSNKETRTTVILQSKRVSK